MARAEVEAISKRLEQSAKSNDANQIAEEYAENADFMPPGQMAINGRAGILQWYREHPVEGVELKSNRIEVIATPDGHVIDRGTYAVEKNGAQLQCGNYVRVFKRIDGKLKILMEIWNSSC